MYGNCHVGYGLEAAGSIAAIADFTVVAIGFRARSREAYPRRSMYSYMIYFGLTSTLYLGTLGIKYLTYIYSCESFPGPPRQAPLIQ